MTPGRGRPRRRSLQPRLLPLAAAATVVTLTLISRDAGRTRPEDPNVFVQDYLRRAVGADHIETDDPAEVRRFLERELGVSLDPIRFVGLDLSRAEICLLEGRRGAMIVYKTDGAVVSHYLVPRQGAAARAPALSARDAGTGLGMPVVTWATDDVEQALVGEVGGDQLLEIAASGVRQAPTSGGLPFGSS